MPNTITPTLLTKLGIVPSAPTSYQDKFEALPLLKASADLNGTFDDAEVEAAASSNLVWEVTGTNAIAPARATGGGITLTTATADGDDVVLGGHTGTGGNPYLSTIDWSTSDELAFYAKIKTAAAIDALTLFAGFKLTSADTVATDNDQVFFRFQDSQSGGNWEFITSDDGRATDDETLNTGVTVEASTTYELVFELDADRVPRAYISTNGGGYAHVATGTALAANIDLLPFVGIETNEAAANAVIVRQIALGKKDND